MENKTFKLGQKIYVPFKGKSPFELCERILFNGKYYCEIQDFAYNAYDKYLIMKVIGIVNFEEALA